LRFFFEFLRLLRRFLFELPPFIGPACDSNFAVWPVVNVALGVGNTLLDDDNSLKLSVIYILYAEMFILEDYYFET